MGVEDSEIGITFFQQGTKLIFFCCIWLSSGSISNDLGLRARPNELNAHILHRCFIRRRNAVIVFLQPVDNSIQDVPDSRTGRRSDVDRCSLLELRYGQPLCVSDALTRSFCSIIEYIMG